jgi:hypothetical protein
MREQEYEKRPDSIPLRKIGGTKDEPTGTSVLKEIFYPKFDSNERRRIIITIVVSAITTLLFRQCTGT